MKTSKKKKIDLRVEFLSPWLLINVNVATDPVYFSCFISIFGYESRALFKTWL